jgi:hypothetical protein
MRKGFNFYRSYYDVAKELSESDRLKFLWAVIQKQFEGIEPSLKGQSNFAYISQKHSIDAQVFGYETKTKLKLTPTQPPCQVPTQPPCQQEKGKEEGKDEGKKEGKKEIIIKEDIFLTPLEIALNNFYVFRIELKKPILESSKEALKDKLIKLSNNDNDIAIEILNQSIANGWQGIFELKQQTNGTTNNTKQISKYHN